VAGRTSGIKMVGKMEVGAPVSLHEVASSWIVAASAFVISPLLVSVKSTVDYIIVRHEDRAKV